MYPSLNEFKRLSQDFERVTVYKEMDGDMDTPVSMLSKFLAFDRAILLESAKQNKTYSRFSFLAFDITEKMVLKQDGVYRNGEFICPLSQLSKHLVQCRTPVFSDFGDFSGGYVGYLNFEFVGECGVLKKPLSRKGAFLGVLYLVERFCVYDNYTNKLYLAVSKPTGDADPEDAYRAVARELDRTEDRIRGLVVASVQQQSPPKLVRDIPRGLFIDKVDRTRNMIGEGEAIQIVLSDYLEAEDINPFEFYRGLRKINPSPYMYFLKDGDDCIVGSSPEIHLHVRNRVATLKPIAGTKKREPSKEIQEIIDCLTNDEKERAEHLMLVDLARNDLSRICKVGTVRVESFMQPEVYSHVVHLVSEVKGRLAEDLHVFDALKQTFPAGTVSGAPKVRAIEVIDEMEDGPRGAYAGCLGYIGFNGSLDMAITIRTGIFRGNRARLQAGAGIVYDSVPEREYDEVLNKLLVLMKSGGLA
ncbi:MAG: Anthranilate synthase component 1 [Syntrophorhabdaceae bacterium PtaU1.Bin034]|nr:MAG: Anthranilate synthase component 1 [Syntrophorhabdaceae bacterium PtaU1.Bin034]